MATERVSREKVSLEPPCDIIGISGTNLFECSFCHHGILLLLLVSADAQNGPLIRNIKRDVQRAEKTSDVAFRKKERIGKESGESPKIHHFTSFATLVEVIDDE